MNFAEAEVKYRELRKQLDLGKPLTRSEVEEYVGRLTVKDDKGTWWEIHPDAGRWMYYDGTQWIYSVPPGRTNSKVVTETFNSSLESPANQASFGKSDPQHLAPRTGQSPVRRLRRRLSEGTNRMWIPYALASGVLFICTCLIFVGGQSIFSGIAFMPEPTQTLPVRVQTITPVPTITLQPTLPIPTATAVPVIGKIIEAVVNVRAAPSLQAAIIGKVTRNEEITLIGRSEDGAWYQVRIGDIVEPSWVFGATIEIASGDPNGLPVNR